MGASLRILGNLRLCETAGFIVIFIETFDVDQSKIAIKKFSNFLLLLIFLCAGDYLSGIKKDLMELDNIISINKINGNNI